ncbi:hypothetical protein [Mesorhizobium sp. B2-3-4]|uniref:hypothetical protein n=1 Tax=Mesorhizobium sp. B2-3-4 TaxID=2589959 RepID=UPI001127BB6C|nr:hypothetical protein [Mesorhizobium sp. B2-3-4]TPM41436.1 hypothetical protein FJ967_00420 [Mesorhizobium sp. B2-3-4]
MSQRISNNAHGGNSSAEASITQIYQTVAAEQTFADFLGWCVITVLCVVGALTLLIQCSGVKIEYTDCRHYQAGDPANTAALNQICNPR